MDRKITGRKKVKMVRIEFCPYGTDKETVKNRVIKKMESEGYVYKNEVALMVYNSVLVFDNNYYGR